MSRKNQKGFLLAESLIVATFVVSLLIFLFVQFKNLSVSYDDGFKYNSVEGLYALDNVRTYLMENSRVTDETKKISDYLAEKEKPYLYIYSSKEGENGECNGTIDLRGTGYCKSLMEAQNIKSVIFAANPTPDGEDQSFPLKDYLLGSSYGADDKNYISEQMKKFIIRTDVREVSHTYRLIAEFNDGSYATFNVGDEDWNSAKHNDPNYVDPSYHEGVTNEGCFEYVDITEGVKITGYTCSNIKDVKIPSSLGEKRVYEIGDNVFNGKDLSSLIMPPGIKKIGTSAFADNKNLTNIIIPESVTMIGSSAFANCGISGTLTIPDLVTSIGNSAFVGNEISSLKIGENLIAIGDSAFNGNGISQIDFNKRLTYIGNAAFAENNLTNVTFPSTLKEIGSDAFTKNSLTKVTIPEKVVYIGERAFVSNNTWTDIEIMGADIYRFNAKWTEIGWPASKLLGTKIYDSTKSGQANEYTVELDGYYRIDLWGASGGNALCASDTTVTCGTGGKGGYTSGVVKLTAGTKLYFHIGRAGSNAANSTTVSGGYNGGGNGSWDQDASTSVPDGSGAGGGATDVRLESGDWNNANSLRSRIMVAAGGGGASWTNTGGHGGGLWGTTNVTSEPGKQTSGNEFGIGQAGTASGVSPNGAGYVGVGGGGSGYYGGQATNTTTSTNNRAGAGGSSYISGYAGVNSITSKTNGTHTNNTEHYSGKYFINTKMINGANSMPNHNLAGTMIGNSGDGHAMITYAGKTAPNNSNGLAKLKNVQYIEDCIQTPSKDSVGSRWIEIQAIADGKNVAKGITATFSPGTATNIAKSTDGKIDTFDDYASISSTTKQCMTINLGEEYNLEEIAVWHYYGTTLSYTSHEMTVFSGNGSFVTVINASNIKETANGIRVK